MTNNGQIILPKNAGERVGVGSGDSVAFIYEGDRVILTNAAIYAMRVLQGGMKGEWKKPGLSQKTIQ